MKEYTRFLREEYNKDYHKIKDVNNSKMKRRSSEQNKQAAIDKHNHYNNKWNGYLEKCETKAQIQYCLNALILNNHRYLAYR